MADKLPKTPSRTVPVAFASRAVVGSFAGAAIGLAHDAWIVGLAAGLVGSVIGTLGGAKGRADMAKAFGRDLPAALVEDAVAIGLAFAIVSRG